MPFFDFLHHGNSFAPRGSSSQEVVVLEEVRACVDLVVLRLADECAHDALCALNEELASVDLSRATRFSKLFAEIHWTHGIVAQQVQQRAANQDGVMGMLASLTRSLAPEQTAEQRLLTAVEQGHLRSAEAVLAEWPNPLQANEEGDQAVHLACLDKKRLRREEGMRLLRAVLQTPGVDINAANGNGGNSPLHIAMAAGVLPAIRLLLAHGADTARKNAYGNTPLDLCRSDAARKAVGNTYFAGWSSPATMRPAISALEVFNDELCSATLPDLSEVKGLRVFDAMRETCKLAQYICINFHGSSGELVEADPDQLAVVAAPVGTSGGNGNNNAEGVGGCAGVGGAHYEERSSSDSDDESSSEDEREGHNERGRAATAPAGPPSPALLEAALLETHRMIYAAMAAEGDMQDGGMQVVERYLYKKRAFDLAQELFFSEQHERAVQTLRGFYAAWPLDLAAATLDEGQEEHDGLDAARQLLVPGAARLSVRLVGQAEASSATKSAASVAAPAKAVEEERAAARAATKVVQGEGAAAGASVDVDVDADHQESGKAENDAGASVEV